jgi:hypothetical protein
MLMTSAAATTSSEPSIARRKWMVDDGRRPRERAIAPMRAGAD